MPIASLPSRYGIGCLDEAAYEFVDQLEKAGQGYWQILPMGPTGYGDSPYQSFSTFAGNPYFNSLSELAKKGYLSEEDLQEYEAAGDNQAVSYNVLYEKRFPLLRKAFWNSRIETSAKYIKFIEDNQDWLGDYALYMAIKDSQNGISYLEWDEDIRLRRPEAIEAYKERLAGEVNFYQFLQFEFFLQWNQLREYAGEHGVKIIGDIPIYVALDSADTWAHPELFELDEKRIPTSVAGCPPDAFSATGQLWGNPLYRWENHEKQGYDWWIKRIRRCFQWYDVVRIDHFRGFDEFYAIPYGDKTAENGAAAAVIGVIGVIGVTGIRIAIIVVTVTLISFVRIICLTAAGVIPRCYRLVFLRHNAVLTKMAGIEHHITILHRTRKPLSNLAIFYIYNLIRIIIFQFLRKGKFYLDCNSIYLNNLLIIQQVNAQQIFHIFRC